MTNFKTGGPWITRFAPSPTGALHLGNARTAVLNYLLARQSGGTFLLRLEDTDQERSSFAAEAGILWSLAWLGLTPDEPVRHQSLRLPLYRQAVDTLLGRDLAYPCFCSESELEREHAQAAAQNLPPRYSGRCAGLSAAERTDRLARGANHVIRFRGSHDTDIHFTDLIKGEITVPGTAFGDFVLLRSNGWPSYNLAVVVDDMDMGVNLVLRGEDHLTNTARQILLYQAFERTAPAFAHHGLLVDPEGKKLSKRTGAPGIRECMDLGLEPLAVVQYLASMAGALPTKTLFASLDDMARGFNPFALGRGNAVMNIEELKALSARAFRAIAPDLLVEKVDTVMDHADPWHGLDNALKLEIVTRLRDNASTLRELRLLLPHFTKDETNFSVQALDELGANLPVLSALDRVLITHDHARRLDASAVSDVLRRTADQAGVKGKQLYHPIRLALTGAQSGPELTTMLSLLPVGRIRQRIQTVLNIFSHSNDKE